MHLTQEELHKLKELQLQNTQITYEVSVRVLEAKAAMESVEQEQKVLYTEYQNIFKQGDELFQTLKTKYGEGSINLDTGEVTNSN
jgi:hypothetical protein